MFTSGDAPGEARAPLSSAAWRRSVTRAAIALVACGLLGVLVGVPGHAPLDVARVLLGGGDETDRILVWQVRVPRVCLAACVGAALALAGGLLQLMLRNPLADPFVLGVSSGAALASVVGLAAGLTHAGGGHPALAALGGLGALALCWRLARAEGGRLSPTRMVLAGVVLSYLCSAGIMWVVTLSPAARGQQVLFWLMGSLVTASSGDAWLLAAVLAPSLGAALWWASALDLLAFSDDHAADAGVPVESVKRSVFVVAALLTGAAVAVAGSIGFVGLVVPHAVRLARGGDARLLLPLSALVGGAFLVVADWASRALGEVPVGVLTASCGAPFFLALLARRRVR